MRQIILITAFVLSVTVIVGASNPSDSLKLGLPVENTAEGPEYRKNPPAKVIHAEPLFIDLIRDLGARKGEKEWNVGYGINPNGKNNDYSALIEYEWAPVDRLGLEIELPFTFNFARDPERPGRSGMDGLKTALQWSFLVSEKYRATFAIGYLNELGIPRLSGRASSRAIGGNLYNPFFIAAKRWGKNFHSLIYTGPVVERDFESSATHTHYQINTNLHYMFGNTRHFVGLEVNQEVHNGQLETTLRPQIRYEISDKLMIGLVTGIPINSSVNIPSTFVRLIYEPEHKKK
jgi:hypothetical protein